MLVRMWRKGNPFALLVGMQTGAATVEISMEIPQKIKNGTAFWPSDPTSGNLSEENQKNVCTPMFIVVLFIIAKIWKQPKCPSVDVGKKGGVHLHNRILLSSKKEETLTFFNSMNGLIRLA